MQRLDSVAFQMLNLYIKKFFTKLFVRKVKDTLNDLLKFEITRKINIILDRIDLLYRLNFKKTCALPIKSS